MEKDRQVFITGATGFLGSYLLRYLIRDGYTNIKASKRSTSKMDLVKEVENKVTWLDIDFNDELDLSQQIEGVSLLIHAAAKVSYKTSDIQDMQDSNFRATKNIVQAALEAKVDKMVYVSSVAALGKHPEGGLISESCDWDKTVSVTPYALSKHQAEMEVWRAAAEGLAVSIINPSVILGAGYWKNSSVKIFGSMAKKQKLYPTGANGFVDVRDVARMALLLCDHKYDGKQFIANAENWPFKKLMDHIADAYAMAGPKWPISKFLIPISWRVLGLISFITRKESIYSKHSVLSSSRISAYDNSKSKKELDFTYTPLSETIAAAAVSFLASRECGSDHGILALN